MKSKILVTGASSLISSTLIEALTSENYSVVVLVRDPQKANYLKELGVEVVAGDLEKPLSLKPAFIGVDKAFILTGPTPRAPEQFSNALWAARQAGVKHVVRLSAYGAAHDAPTINGRLHALSDSELEASGIAYTIVKPHFFMQNLAMAIAESKDTGVLHFAMGEGRMGLIDAIDIANFSARILTTDGHINKTYTLTGPESISIHDVASAVGKVTGSSVAYEAVSVEEYLRSLEIMGVDGFTLNVLRDYFNAYSNNWGDVVTDDFSIIMNRKPRDISEFLC